MSHSKKVRAVCKTGAVLSLLAVAGGAYAQSSASQTAAATDFVAGTSGGGQSPLQTVLAQVTVQGAIPTIDAGGLAVSGFTAQAATPGLTVAGLPRRFALPGQKGDAAAGGGQAWNAWFSIAQNNVGFSFAPINASGRVNAATVGADYTFSNKVLLGVSVTGDQSRISLNGSSVTGSLNGSGTTVSPYLGVPLNQNWTLNAGLGFGKVKTDILVNNLSSKLTTDRTVANVGLAYRQGMGNWLLTGRGAYISVNDQLGSYTLSNGTFVTSGKTRVEQLRFGGQAAYNAGSVIPYVGLTYIYDVKKPNGAAIAGQTPANDRDAFQLALGLQFRGTGSLYGGVQYSTDQSRQQVKNNQIMFNMGVRF